MELALLEKELDIININNSKKQLLNKMLELEYLGLIDEDYFTKIDLYKRLTTNEKRIVDNLDDKEKLMIISNLQRLNIEKIYNVTLKDAISNKSDKYNVLQRTIIDLGAELTQLYRENRIDRAKRELVSICSMYGVELENEISVADEELVNH